MKKNIHPSYYQTKVVCACGNTFTIGSTTADIIKVEVCYMCHPFYTGKQKLIDTTGRVDKFKRRTKMAEEWKQTKKESPTPTVETPMVAPEPLMLPVESAIPTFPAKKKKVKRLPPMIQAKKRVAPVTGKKKAVKKVTGTKKKLPVSQGKKPKLTSQKRSTQKDVPKKKTVLRKTASSQKKKRA